MKERKKQGVYVIFGKLPLQIKYPLKAEIYGQIQNRSAPI